jgi:hypothetical protein
MASRPDVAPSEASPVRTRRLSLAVRSGAAALVLGVVLTGCGGGDGNGVDELEPRAIVDAAREAAQAQESVSMSGSVEQQGETVSLDLLLTQGGSAEGTVAVADTEVRLVASGNDLFIGADLFSAQGVQVPEGVEFVQVPRDSTGFEDVSSLVDLPSFFEELLSPEGELTKEDGPDVDGTPTVAVISDAEPAGRLLVATEGEPLPLRIEGVQDDQEQSISFDFGVAADVSAPDPETVVSVEELVGEAPPGQPGPEQPEEQPQPGEQPQPEEQPQGE